jgi:excisionase family DNA binding protein
MEKPSFTFEQLPQAIAGLYDRLHFIESLIQAKPAQQAPPGTDRWFSIDELIDYLPGKPAKATIYGKVHSREIPHKKVGKRLAFLKSEIDQWLQAQSRKTAKEIEVEAESLIQSKKKRG